METSTKHKRSGFVRLAIAGSVAAVLFAFGLVSYRHQTELIINTANHFLSPYDIRITNINGIVPGFSSLYVDGLTLEMATRDGTLMHVTEQTFEGVSISFNARDLVHNQLKQIVIERASLRPPPLTAPEGHAEAFVFTGLPFESLRINQLHVAGWIAQGQLQVTAGKRVADILFSTDSLAMPVSRFLSVLALNEYIESLDISADGNIDAAFTAKIRLHAADSESEQSFSVNINAERIWFNLESLNTTSWRLAQSRVSAANTSIRCNRHRSCSGSSNLTANIGSMGATNLLVESVSLAADMEFNVLENSLQARLQAGSTLRLETLALGEVSINLVETTLGNALTAGVNTDINIAYIHSNKLLLDLPLIQMPEHMLGLQLEVHELAMAYNTTADMSEGLDLSALSVETSFDASQIYTNLFNVNVWSMHFSQQLKLTNLQLSSEHRIQAQGRETLTARVIHDLQTHSGNGYFSLAAFELTTDAPLSSLLSPIPWQADLVAGNILANASLNWSPSTDSGWQFSGPIELKAQELAGYYNNIAFAGLTSEVNGSIQPGWQLQTPAMQSFMLASVDAGLRLTDISGSYQLNSVDRLVDIANLEVGVFGGTISSDRIRYKGGGITQFSAQLQAIDLAQLMSLSAYDAVSATGLINGTLPIELRPIERRPIGLQPNELRPNELRPNEIGGITPLVTGGRLRALPPGGTIRYDSGISGTGNQSLDLVYQALQHYRYDMLEADVDYRSDGELLLAVRMQGLSPELNQGQRINLNLNVSDDIPALLQSLQAGRSVTDALQRQMSR
jgi:hypothetical protein